MYELQMTAEEIYRLTLPFNVIIVDVKLGIRISAASCSESNCDIVLAKGIIEYRRSECAVFVTVLPFKCTFGGLMRVLTKAH